MLGGVFALVAAAGLFWLAYRRPRPRRWLIPRRQPVAARTASGRSLPFASPADTTALEVELARPLGPDGDDQAGRWVEAASGLREARRVAALPAVLRCADAAAGLPGGGRLAAEALGFPNFAATLKDTRSATGRLAVKALGTAARGGRDGVVDLAPLIRAGFGDHLAAVSTASPPEPNPWLTTAVIEAERTARRVEQWARHLPADVRDLVGRQHERLAASADRRRRWLRGAAARLIGRFPTAPADERGAILRVLDELRADTSALFPELPDRRSPWWADAVRTLRWAKDRDHTPALAEQADRMLSGRYPGVAAAAVLTALRGARLLAAEQVVLRGLGHPDPLVRRAAAAATGWADPLDRAAVIRALNLCRSEADAGLRRAAVAALARFGELAALREFAQGLLAEEPAVRRATALSAAEEGVSWLWPDLDLVADHAEPETAIAAAEALERMREAALGLLG
jgi:hypothetical protein